MHVSMNLYHYLLRNRVNQISKNFFCVSPFLHLSVQTMSSHAARISFLHSIRATGRVTEPAIRECVFSLAKNGHIRDSMRMMTRYDSPRLLSSVLAGAAESQYGGIPSQLFSQIDFSNIAREDVVNLMKIFSIKGIHPQHAFRDKLVVLFKRAVEEDSTCARLVIACFRRIKDERKFVWKLYLGMNGPDDMEITRSVCQIAGINGWGESRVRLIMSRRSGPISEGSAAMLIKALCHHPNTGSVELVNEIINITEAANILAEPLLSSIIEYHSVNKRFDEILNLIQSASPTPHIFHIVLRHAVSDEEKFFQLYSIMENEFGIKPNECIVKAGIDLAINSMSAKNLLRILQSAHAAKIRVDDSQMARLVALTNSFQVPVRVRRRIREMIQLLDPSFIS